MEMPPLQATIRDPTQGLTYEVCAYRAITRDEAVTAIRLYLASQKRKPKRGSVVRIITTIGTND